MCSKLHSRTAARTGCWRTSPSAPCRKREATATQNAAFLLLGVASARQLFRSLLKIQLSTSTCHPICPTHSARTWEKNEAGPAVQQPGHRQGLTVLTNTPRAQTLRLHPHASPQPPRYSRGDPVWAPSAHPNVRSWARPAQGPARSHSAGPRGSRPAGHRSPPQPGNDASHSCRSRVPPGSLISPKRALRSLPFS